MTMIVRETSPDNIESLFSALDGPLTSNANFYIRDHFPAPNLDRGEWRLRVEGAVERPLEFSYEDLKKFPMTKHTALLECAGNSRVFLSPKTEGVQWELGAVGCAEWTGISLSTLLEQAGVQQDAVDVVLEGADEGVPEKSSKPKGNIHYARSLPLARARGPEVLLAFEMNGDLLPAAHGGPVRAIVPGWYAMSSVKWLTRIVVTRRPFNGYFQTVEYTYWKEDDVLPAEQVQIGEIAVKSAIARPAMHEQIALGKDYRIFGAAWASDDAVVRVEISTDDGATWVEAKLASGPKEHAWRLWEFAWKPEKSGRYMLRSRATDSRGHTQPAEHDWNYGNYIVDHTFSIPVEVA